jgi:hypothetical protein
MSEEISMARKTIDCRTVPNDVDRPGRHVAVVEFPGYAEAMANSGHPATEAFGKELRSISTGEPQFRNLNVLSTQAY